MSAVWMRLRSEIRTRWRAWLGLAVLIGLAAGATAAAAAGARRTETAYPRFVQAQEGYDLVTGGFPDKVNPERALAEMEAMPEVDQWARVDVAAYAAILPTGRLALPPELMAITDLMGRAGFQFNRFKVVSGRLANPHAAGEAVIDFATAEREGLRRGSIVRFIVGDPNTTPRRLAAVRIVGIVATPGEFPAVGASSAFGTVSVTPAFVRSHRIRPSPADASLVIRLRHGAADRPGFLRHLAAAGLGGIDISSIQPAQTAAIQRSIGLESQALWALCALTGLAGFVILGQALARQTYLGSADLPTLRALGLSHSQLVLLGMLRAGAIGAAAACLVIPVAVLLSPLTPLGLARIAEPTPGFAVESVPLTLGAISALVLTILACAAPAWSAARTATMRAGDRRPGSARSSTLLAALSRAWHPPTAAAGIRLAFQPGRDSAAVPVRGAVVGATVSIAALAASLVFAASLGRVLDTARLAGFTWDAYVAVQGQQARAAAALRADPKIAGYARGGFTNVRIGNLELMALVLGGSPGPTRPVIIAGTAPAAGDEIALGAATMRAAHTGIGETVNLTLDQAEGHPAPVRMRVTGTAVIPPSPYLATRPGEGAAIAVPGLARIDPGATRQPGGLPFLVRFAPGVSRDAGLAAVTNDTKDLPTPVIFASERPANVISLARIADVPVFLSGLLTLLAAGTLAHMLVSSTRRRRRDLAILKTLGFTRSQLRAVVAWQATTITVIALLIGLPAGIAAGKWAWRAFAAQLGVVPDPALQPVAILIAIPGALVLANLIAALPGQAAARTRPARVLRSE